MTALERTLRVFVRPGNATSSNRDVAVTAAIVCKRSWVFAPSTIVDLVHLHLEVGRPADTACCLFIYRRT